MPRPKDKARRKMQLPIGKYNPLRSPIKGLLNTSAMCATMVAADKNLPVKYCAGARVNCAELEVRIGYNLDQWITVPVLAPDLIMLISRLDFIKGDIQKIT